jgi:hypothetical protein
VVTHKPLDLRPDVVRCPRCFNKDIVPSRPRGWRDACMAWIGMIPRHCRVCEKRFYVRAGAQK